MLVTLIGPAGVGKTSLGDALINSLPTGRWVRTYTTRPLRTSEGASSGRLHCLPATLDYMEERGLLAWRTALYGSDYGTSREDVEFALIEPEPLFLLDFGPENLDLLPRTSSNARCVIVLPPSDSALRERLARDGRTDRAVQALGALEQCRSVLRDPHALHGFLGSVVNHDIESAARELRGLIENGE